MNRLADVARLFLKLGITAFGGPAAHIAMMEDEVVRRRKWLSHEDFLDLLGATNLIPGPNSTEMAIHIGHRRAGWRGLMVAGTCFIVPAMFLVGILAWAYVRFGRLPEAEGILYGVKPVVLAIVLQALWRLSRSAFKTKLLILVGAAAAVLGFLGVNVLLILFAAGIILIFSHSLPSGKARGFAIFIPGLPAAAATATGVTAGDTVDGVTSTAFSRRCRPPIVYLELLNSPS